MFLQSYLSLNCVTKTTASIRRLSCTFTLGIIEGNKISLFSNCICLSCFSSFLEYFTKAAVICQQNKRGNDIHRKWLDKTPIITLVDEGQFIMMATENNQGRCLYYLSKPKS